MARSVAAVLMVLFFMATHAAAASSAPDAYQKANKLFAAARYQEALDLYNKTLEAPPRNVPLSELHTRIGDVYFRLGKFNNARDAYRSALSGQEPSERPQTQYWIGFCTFLAGRDAEAVAELLKVPQLYPASGMWIATAYYWAGRASERMGRKEQAVEFYKKAGGNGKSTQGRFAMKKAEKMEGGSK